MKNALVKLARNAGIGLGLTVLGVAGVLGAEKYVNHVDPMGGVTRGYVVVESGDTAIGLCKKEGWTQEEIYAHRVQNWSSNIHPGDILGIPQHPENPSDELGSTGRPAYESREAAREAQKARWAEYSTK